MRRLAARCGTHSEHALPGSRVQDRSSDSGGRLLDVEEAEPMLERSRNRAWPVLYFEEARESGFRCEAKSLGDQSFGQRVGRNSTLACAKNGRFWAFGRRDERLPIIDNPSIPLEAYRLLARRARPTTSAVTASAASVPRNREGSGPFRPLRGQASESRPEAPPSNGCART